MRIFIETYGCTFNQADSDILKAKILDTDHYLTDSAEDSDLIILNSCGVKGATEQKIFHRIKKLKDEGKKVILTGCLPPINVKETKKLGVSVLGPRSYDHLFKVIDNVDKELWIMDESDKSKEKRVFSGPIARIPVSEGCLSMCSFCATRIARGRLVTYDEDKILDWMTTAVSGGAKELQLNGQDMGCYGMDNGNSWETLIQKIDNIEGNFRVRFGMANPQYMKRIPTGLFESKKIYKFLHLPIQSGNDQVLNDMKRGHNVQKVVDFIKEMRESGDFTFETDIIVGFPTESEEAFQDTLDFVKEMKPDMCNVSRFTARPNTKAAEMETLDNQIVKKRVGKMVDLCHKVSEERKRKFIGKTEEILILENGTNGTKRGRTNSYRRVVLNKGKLGTFTKAKIVSSSVTSLFAEDR